MKFAALLSLALLLAPACGQLGCFNFVCDPGTAKWPDAATCGVQDPVTSTQLDIRSCPSGQYCQTFPDTTDNPQCMPFPVQALMYPGEPCDEFSFPCSQGKCTNGRCPGLQVGDKCLFVSDCGGNLTCSDGKCTELVDVGQECTVSTDCVKRAGCVGATERSKGVCTAYYSTGMYQVAPDCDNASYIGSTLVANLYCRSGYCFRSSSGLNLCADALPSASELPVSCNATNPCVSMTDPVAQTHIEGLCVCSLSGEYYCDLFPGDMAYLTYINYIVEFLSSDAVDNCNVSNDLSMTPYFSYMSPCNTLVNNVTDEMKLAYYRTIGYSHFLNVEECVLQILNPDYYSALVGSGWSSFFS